MKSPLPAGRRRDLDVMLEDWSRLTVALNQFEQSLGNGPVYPGPFTDTVLGKLRFVDALCRQAAERYRSRR